MSLLPFVNQFILPTFISVYAVIVSLLPYTGAHPIIHKTSPTIEKKVAAVQTTPTPTPIQSGPTIEEKEKTPTHKDTTTKENSEFGSLKNEQPGMTTENPTPTHTTFQGDTQMSSATDTTPTPFPEVSTPAIVATTVTAKSTITASGKTITLTMKYPSVGGSITGAISGDCSGTISGIYDGPSKQTLSGKGRATCPMGFVNISVMISYSGKLTSSTIAQITYTVSALGRTESGSTDLKLK